MRSNPNYLDALAAGSAAAVTTTLAIAACGRSEDVSAWAPLNAISHIAWGDEAAAQVAPSWKYSATGIGLNACAMLSWGAVYSVLAGGRKHRSVTRALVAGAATAATAYVVDYHVVPRRLTPGFEKRLSRPAMVSIFASLAIGLVLGSYMRSQPEARCGA